jgi:hypothetical protein
VSPIFVRPVREQLEHDRLIRHLIPKYKRKFEVAANIGEEQAAPVKLGGSTFYPDLVLTDKKKLAGLVEVESAESVNNLEAMAQWVPFSRSRVPFHLYVPVQAFDVARRFCESHQAAVTEIWTYRPAADGFDLVRMVHDTSAPSRTPPKRERELADEKPAAPPPPRRPAKAKPEAPSAKPGAITAARTKSRAKAPAKPAKSAAKSSRTPAKKSARTAKSTGRKR